MEVFKLTIGYFCVFYVVYCPESNSLMYCRPSWLCCIENGTELVKTWSPVFFESSFRLLKTQTRGVNNNKNKAKNPTVLYTRMPDENPQQAVINCCSFARWCALLANINQSQPKYGTCWWRNDLNPEYRQSRLFLCVPQAIYRHKGIKDIPDVYQTHYKQMTPTLHRPFIPTKPKQIH